MILLDSGGKRSTHISRKYACARKWLTVHSDGIGTGEAFESGCEPKRHGGGEESRIYTRLGWRRKEVQPMTSQRGSSKVDGSLEISNEDIRIASLIEFLRGISVPGTLDLILRRGRWRPVEVSSEVKRSK